MASSSAMQPRTTPNRFCGTVVADTGLVTSSCSDVLIEPASRHIASTPFQWCARSESLCNVHRGVCVQNEPDVQQEPVQNDDRAPHYSPQKQCLSGRWGFYWLTSEPNWVTYGVKSGRELAVCPFWEAFFSLFGQRSSCTCNLQLQKTIYRKMENSRF